MDPTLPSQLGTMSFPLRWLAWLSTLVATVHATVEPVEVDLVFPRNETYSPTDEFPIVFAVQNPQRAELLNLDLSYFIGWGDSEYNYTLGRSNLLPANLSSADPYFAYSYFNMNRTNYWYVSWTLRWQSCDEEALVNDNEGGLFSRSHQGTQYFTTDDSAPKDVDLVAATADATCPNLINSIMIYVTDTIMQSPAELNQAVRDTCVLTVDSPDTANSTAPDPCRIAIDEQAAASMAAARREECDPSFNTYPPEDCPAKNGALQPAALAVSSFLAVFGVLRFVLL